MSSEITSLANLEWFTSFMKGIRESKWYLHLPQFENLQKYKVK